MKNKLLTLKELRKGWWWNQKEIRQDGVRGVDWPAVEAAARNYELLRRSPKGKQFVKPYLELVPDERSVIHGLWARRLKSAYRCAIRREQYNEKGWTPVYETEHWQWNLRLADKNLIDEFIRNIRILRKIQKIRAQHPLKGEKYRGVSWKLIEILDRKQNGIGKLNASQRHTLYIAQRRAEKYFIEYRRALAKQKNNPNRIFDSETLASNDEPLQL